MRRRYDEIKAKGAEVVAVGMGFPELAAEFRTKFRIPFPLLVDHGRVTYKSVGLARGSFNDVMGPAVVAKGAVEFVKGNLQALPPKGTDRMQLGGVAVVDKGGEVLLVHRSKTSADNIPVDTILEALA